MLVVSLDLIRDRFPFVLFATVNDVRMSNSLHRAVGRNRNDFQIVNLSELFGLGHRRTSHSADFVIQFEVVLQRDGGQRLSFLFDLHAFFGLNGLVQTVAPLTSFHQATGELVHDHNRAFFDDVVHIFLVQTMRLERVVDHVRPVHVAGRVETFDARQFLRRANTFVS